MTVAALELLRTVAFLDSVKRRHHFPRIDEQHCVVTWLGD